MHVMIELPRFVARKVLWYVFYLGDLGTTNVGYIHALWHFRFNVPIYSNTFKCQAHLTFRQSVSDMTYLGVNVLSELSLYFQDTWLLCALAMCNKSW